ncbi:MAG: DNA polymerase ligase N-terminal domain-containing protein [Nitrososphaerota archaeon]|nr:3'-phosphoesterase [Candidatus Geocrenenecus dongiae]
MPIFVVHEHHAKKAGLHYDLRLEIDNVLKSWALRKEPPTTHNVKRLCIPQPDHELSYANFEGEIPEGQYGAGTVKIWDKGEYKILEYDPDKKMVVYMMGEKLRGKYILINTSRGWLFFKGK